MSIHTDRAFKKAAAKGGAAARTYDEWNALMALSKRELAEVAVRLAARFGDSSDDAIESGEAFQEVMREWATLTDCGVL